MAKGRNPSGSRYNLISEGKKSLKIATKVTPHHFPLADWFPVDPQTQTTLRKLQPCLLL